MGVASLVMLAQRLKEQRMIQRFPTIGSQRMRVHGQVMALLSMVVRKAILVMAQMRRELHLQLHLRPLLALRNFALHGNSSPVA